MTTVEEPLVQPDPSTVRLPGESYAHYEARRETGHATGHYQRGWWDARNALVDAAAGLGLTEEQREALWRLMDATRDDKAAVDKFRAEEYRWRREWADEEDAREAARKAGVS